MRSLTVFTSFRPRAGGKRFVTSLNWVSTFFLNSRLDLSRSALGNFFVLALCSRMRLLLSARISPSFTLRLSVYLFLACVIPDCRFFFFFFLASTAARRPAACWAPCPLPAPAAPELELLEAAPPPPVTVTLMGAAWPTPPAPP